MIRRLAPLAAALAALLLVAAPPAHAQGPTNPTAPPCTAERFHQGFNHLVAANWTAYDRDTDPTRTLGRGFPRAFIEYASWADHSLNSDLLLAMKPPIKDGTVEVFANADDRAYSQDIWGSAGDRYVYGRGPMMVTVYKHSYFPEQAPIFESILGEACP